MQAALPNNRLKLMTVVEPAVPYALRASDDYLRIISGFITSWSESVDGNINQMIADGGTSKVRDVESDESA